MPAQRIRRVVDYDSRESDLKSVRTHVFSGACKETMRGIFTGLASELRACVCQVA